MHRIDPEDTPGQEAANATPFETAIDRGQNEAAENEEDIDRDIARLQRRAVKRIAHHAKHQIEVMTEDPERRESADRGQRKAFLAHGGALLRRRRAGESK